MELEQRPADLADFDALASHLVAAGDRVVRTALACRGNAAALPLFVETTRAVFRAMPPLLGPANASLRVDRPLWWLAEQLHVTREEFEETMAAIPHNDPYELALLDGSFVLLVHREKEEQHQLVLRPIEDELRGALFFSPSGHASGFLVEREGMGIRFTAVDAEQRRCSFAFTWSAVAAERSALVDLVGVVRWSSGETDRCTARWTPSTPGCSPAFPSVSQELLLGS